MKDIAILKVVVRSFTASIIYYLKSHQLQLNIPKRYMTEDESSFDVKVLDGKDIWFDEQ